MAGGRRDLRVISRASARRNGHPPPSLGCAVLFCEIVAREVAEPVRSAISLDEWGVSASLWRGSACDEG